ncbi:MAG: hypothetical protein RMI91_03175 [Gemmatales bacterium]|nr:hypothetical protein [Gemmatales bacterium]MDW7993632.1 hypothetical protein [Gemmatales bacterium]
MRRFLLIVLGFFPDAPKNEAIIAGVTPSFSDAESRTFTCIVAALGVAFVDCYRARRSLIAPAISPSWRRTGRA